MDFAMDLMKAQQNDMTVANFKGNNNQGYNKLEKALKGYVFTVGESKLVWSQNEFRQHTVMLSTRLAAFMTDRLTQPHL